MAEFYGTLQGQAGKATRRGSKSSGLVTYAASWQGAVKVELVHNKTTGRNEYRVSLVPWQNVGESRELAQGSF
jgi:hypothetical protein